MNTGIQDAHNLAWKLAMVLAGTAGPELLDSYESERRPVAEHVVTTTDRLTRAATLRRRPARRVRNAVFRTLGRVPAVRHRLAMELSQLAVGYAKGRGRHPRAGDRAPLQLLPPASGAPRWRLLLPAGGAEPSAVQAAGPIPIAVQNSSETAAALLVRPDGYVWASAFAADAARLVAGLPSELGSASAAAEAVDRS